MCLSPVSSRALSFFESEVEWRSVRARACTYEQPRCLVCMCMCVCLSVFVCCVCVHLFGLLVPVWLVLRVLCLNVVAL